ncbi:MAG: hypothetical protein JNL57_04990 [Bacteroidetes bacterium]|nr:hypothetical protein [Bacteroidota bacterium]
MRNQRIHILWILAAALLAVLPVLQTAGVLVRKHYVHCTWIKNLPRESAVVIHLPVSKFKSVKPGGEIQWQHADYDVISVVRNGDLLHVLAVRDKIETALRLSADNGTQRSANKSLISIKVPDWDIHQKSVQPVVSPVCIMQFPVKEYLVIQQAIAVAVQPPEA